MAPLQLPPELASLPNHGACPNPLTDIPVVVTGKSPGEISAAVANIQEQDSAYYPTGVCLANGQDILLFGQDPARRLADLTSAEAPRKLHIDLVKAISITQLAIIKAKGDIRSNENSFDQAQKIFKLFREHGANAPDKIKALYREYVLETSTGRILSSAAYAVLAFGFVTSATKDIFTGVGYGVNQLTRGRYLSLFSKVMEHAHLRELQKTDTSGCMVNIGRPGLGLAGNMALRYGTGAAALAGLVLWEKSRGATTSYEIPKEILADPEYKEFVENDARLKDHKAYMAKLEAMGLKELNDEYEKLNAELALLGTRVEMTANKAATEGNIFEILQRDPTKTEADLRKLNLAALEAIVAEMRKKGINGPSDEGLMRQLGLEELIGLGLGFGPGTDAFHQLWRKLTPWQNTFDRFNHQIEEEARARAVQKYATLKSQQCRAQAGEEAEPVQVPAAVPEKAAETLERAALRSNSPHPPLRLRGGNKGLRGGDRGRVRGGVSGSDPVFDPAAIPQAAFVDGGWQSDAKHAGQSVVSAPIFGQSADIRNTEYSRHSGNQTLQVVIGLESCRALQSSLPAIVRGFEVETVAVKTADNVIRFPISRATIVTERALATGTDGARATGGRMGIYNRNVGTTGRMATIHRLPLAAAPRAIARTGGGSGVALGRATTALGIFGWALTFLHMAAEGKASGQCDGFFSCMNKGAELMIEDAGIMYGPAGRREWDQGT